MGSTAFGNFGSFCQYGTLPACNLFTSAHNGTGYGGCELQGIPLPNDQHLANLGSILLAGIAIFTSLYLLWRTDRKEAAVGRREIQLFLVGYIVVEICEIFSMGGFPLPDRVRIGFTAAHLAAIAATCWILMLNAVVGFQLLDDGTLMSLGLMLASAAAIFIGTGYIALDTGLSWTHHFDDSYNAPEHRNIGLYVLYLLVPLICIVVFFLLETWLVLRVLGERKPMLYLLAAAVLFALAQIFTFTINPYICNGTMMRINGALFETLFTLLAVVTVWIFWSSITEDDWQMPTTAATYP